MDKIDYVISGFVIGIMVYIYVKILSTGIIRKYFKLKKEYENEKDSK